MKLTQHLRTGRLAAALGAVLMAGSITAATWPERLSPRAVGYCERAMLMVKSGNYQGVIDQLRHLVTQQVELTEAEATECSYLLAKALYETGDADCLSLLHDFAATHPASPLALNARLAEADYYYFDHDYAAALELYDDIDFSRLDASQLPAYTYRKGLCQVKRGLYDESVPAFTRLLGYGQYREAGRYYLAYIEYLHGDYDKAYDTFASIGSEMPDMPDTQQDAAPTGRHGRRRSNNASMARRGNYQSDGLEPGYYMTQIEFARGQYQNVIDHGRSLLERRNVAELVPGTERVIGLSYYKLGDFTPARQYLENYIEHTGTSAADDARYALAVIDYKEERYTQAAEALTPLTDLQSDLGQSAYLYLGQCAAAQGDSNAAAIAFEKATRMSYDNAVSEAALYNYVASRTHGGQIPFSSSVELLENFLKRYPRSEYAPRVKEFLATAYYNERDYRRALASIENIKKPSSSVLAAKQKILFELGVEELSNGNAAAAAGYLRQAADSKSDAAIATDATLWLGDALYDTGDYRNAENAYRRYLNGRGNADNKALARYDLAYALYRQEKFAEATRQFRDASSDSSLPEAQRTDAIVRLADCLYYTGDYRGATDQYTRAIDSNAQTADYAMFRRAIMYGHAGDITRKVNELSLLTQKYPDSRWLPDAILEQGETYAALGQTSKAAETFALLDRDHSSTPQNRQGMLQMAIAYMKEGRTAEAEQAYRRVISTWPTSQEAALANEDLRRHYAAKGELNEYAEYLAGIDGAPRLDPDQMERLAFDAAESALADDVKATAGLERYVEQYPDGQNLAQALYDLAEAEQENGLYTHAITHIDMLLEKRADSRQVPGALLIKANIMENRIGAPREEIAEVYRQLERRGGADFAPEAYAGIMRYSDDPAERMAYAQRVRQTGGLSADQMDEALYCEAEGMMDAGRTDEGAAIYERLAANPMSESGAKAAVTLGEYWLQAGQPAKAEKVLAAFTDAGTPHQYWLARGFIALADSYHAQKKTYLGIEYLKSLQENYPGDDLDIHDMIAQRLKAWK